MATIGPRECRRRLTFGVVLLAAGASLAAFLIGVGVHPLWRLLVFVPLWAGALGVFQARDHT